MTSDDDSHKSKKLGSMDLMEFDQLKPEERVDKWKEIQSYIEALQSMVASPKTGSKDDSSSTKEDPVFKKDLSIMAMKLARKDREVQELLSNVQEMRQYQAPSVEQLRRMLLDPAVNIMFKDMSCKLQQTERKLSDTQEDMAAWKFTPDSTTGKRLMSKCRQLYLENEQLGQQINSGRLAKLEGDLALQKQANLDLKKTHTDLEECIEEGEEESEALESMCHFFQANVKLKEKQVGELHTQLTNVEEARGAGWTCGKCGHSYDTTSSSAPPYAKLNHIKTDVEQEPTITTNHTNQGTALKKRRNSHTRELAEQDEGRKRQKVEVKRVEKVGNSDPVRTNCLEGNPRKDRTVENASSSSLTSSPNGEPALLTANGHQAPSPPNTDMEEEGAAVAVENAAKQCAAAAAAAAQVALTDVSGSHKPHTDVLLNGNVDD